MSWLIYGANGYTGQLVARLAVARGERPVLAGRNGPAVTPLAGELGLPHRVFDLADGAAVRAALEGVRAVAHCAGPFSATSAPMVAGCLAAGAHYLDITGEVEVFEAIFGRTPRPARPGWCCCRVPASTSCPPTAWPRRSRRPCPARRRSTWPSWSAAG